MNADLEDVAIDLDTISSSCVAIVLEPHEEIPAGFGEAFQEALAQQWPGDDVPLVIVTDNANLLAFSQSDLVAAGLVRIEDMNAAFLAAETETAEHFDGKTCSLETTAGEHECPICHFAIQVRKELGIEDGGEDATRSD